MLRPRLRATSCGPWKEVQPPPQPTQQGTARGPPSLGTCPVFRMEPSAWSCSSLSSSQDVPWSCHQLGSGSGGSWKCEAPPGLMDPYVSGGVHSQGWARLDGEGPAGKKSLGPESWVHRGPPGEVLGPRTG